MLNVRQIAVGQVSYIDLQSQIDLIWNLYLITAASIEKCKNEDKKCLATIMTDLIKRAATKGNFWLKFSSSPD